MKKKNKKSKKAKKQIDSSQLKKKLPFLLAALIVFAGISIFTSGIIRTFLLQAALLVFGVFYEIYYLRVYLRTKDKNTILRLIFGLTIILSSSNFILKFISKLK